MLPQNKPDRIRILFDDHRLVANAGLLLPATLAWHLGLRELVTIIGGAPGRANTIPLLQYRYSYLGYPYGMLNSVSISQAVQFRPRWLAAWATSSLLCGPNSNTMVQPQSWLTNWTHPKSACTRPAWYLGRGSKGLQAFRRIRSGEYIPYVIICQSS